MTMRPPSRPLSLLPTTRRGVKVVGLLTLVALSAAGCFQPSGSILEKTSVAQSAPTFTPPPTETPTETDMPTVTASPEQPTATDTPAETDVPTITPTEAETDVPTTPSPEAVALLITATPAATLPPGVLPTAIILPPYTEVAFLQQDPAQDPIFATATALANLLNGGQAEPPPDTFDTLDTEAQQQDPFGTATAIIQTATAQQSVPLTQTAEALFGGGGIIASPTTGIIPGATPTFALLTPTSGPILGGTDCVHEVQNTDRNLFRISLAYGVTVDQIARSSGIVNPNLIYFGQRLVIPGCGTTGLRPPPTSVGDGGPDEQSPGGGTGGGGGATYTVQQNDTLFEISLQYGVTVNAIAAANGISNINLIFIGQQLVIP